MSPVMAFGIELSQYKKKSDICHSSSL
jgi:hypothetical protein